MLGIRAAPPVFVPFLGGAVVSDLDLLDRRHHAVIAIAGPAAGIAASLVTTIMGHLLYHPALMLAGLLGLASNAFNLIPIPPFDGGWVAAAVSPWMWTGGVVAMSCLILSGHVGRWVILILLLGTLQACLVLRERAGATTKLKRSEKAIIFAAHGGLLLGSGSAIALFAPRILPTLQFF